MNLPPGAQVAYSAPVRERRPFVGPPPPQRARRVRPGVPENTIMKIAGWKTPSMFRRYDIRDGKDIQRAGKNDGEVDCGEESGGPKSPLASGAPGFA